MSDQNLIAKLTALLGIDKDKVIDHVAEMGVDNILEVVDAINNDDADRARELLGVDEDGAAEGQDVETDAHPEQDVETEPKAEDDGISPLFHHIAAKKGEKKNKRLTAVEEEDYVPNIGDDVIVGEDEGTVKIAKAPGDTVGVQIDGEMVMVKKDKVQRGQMNEGVLGMTAMQDLRRMQQLAGIAPAASNDEFAVPSITCGGEASPLAAGTFEVEQPAVTTTVIDGAGLDAPADTQAAEAVAADEHGPYLSFDGILSSFDEIEAGLPELRVKDAKVVRQRLNALMAKLNETRFTYKPKV